MSLPVFGDAAGQVGPNPRQPLDFFRRGHIDIDALAGSQRTGQLGGAASQRGLAGYIAAADFRSDERGAGRIGRSAGANGANNTARRGNGGQEQQSAALVGRKHTPRYYEKPKSRYLSAALRY